MTICIQLLLFAKGIKQKRDQAIQTAFQALLSSFRGILWKLTTGLPIH